MTKLDKYIELLAKSSQQMADGVKATSIDFLNKHIKTFTYMGEKSGLLLGNVQSGKTGQMLGIISAAADEGFDLFLILTTDNVYLQQQTYSRAIQYMDDFNICDEPDEIRFTQTALRKPTIVILKKNSRILQKWRNNLSSSGLCSGRPVFIVDDEGDAASLNTKVNQQDQSSINKHLESIKKLFTSSFYLQVTATPQSILLLTKLSGFRPSFIQYFTPGEGYLGGNFFYPEEGSYTTVLTKENELDDLLDEEEPMPSGLRDSVLTYLVTSAHLISSGEKEVCNFLIHPSVRIEHHEKIANKISTFLNELLESVREGELKVPLKEKWEELQRTKPDIRKFEDLYKHVQDYLDNMKYKIVVMNSTSKDDSDVSKGMNIIIGGNSLGRGVTFPVLQTVYYCRKSRTPQADTFWQHCRMFGYDRDPGLMRIYIPPLLLKLFTDINKSNQALLDQVNSKGIDEINLLHFKGTKPTRNSVVDQTALSIIAGGVNYFPSYPVAKNLGYIDQAVKGYKSEEFEIVNIDLGINLLNKLASEKKEDWDQYAFLNAFKTIKATNSSAKIVLIIRKGRNISKGTGTLLSPNDRKLGLSFNDIPVLTLYRIEGGKDWKKLPIWVPNIKFPREMNFYRSE